MPTAPRTPPLLLLLLGVTAAPLTAQICAGSPGFRSTPVRIAGGLDLGDGYTSIGGSMTTGKENGLFYGGGLAIFSPDFGDGGIAITGIVGKELERPIGERLRLCPFGGLTHTTEAGFGSVTDFFVGGTVGYPLESAAGARTRFVLTGGYTGVYQRYQLGGGFGSAEEWYGIIDAGVGIILSDNLTLSPGMRLFFRFSGGRDPSILLRASYGLGGR